ncbi:hypothetical protein F4819DRAFT_481925 [Hypoxylon fuscum]|nr:hypothetical protein F4819DRAFT_481925 [Hypoxylon fuscum]
MAPSKKGNTLKTNGGGDGGGADLTEREIRVVAKAFQCITAFRDGVPQVDAKKLAAIAPYSSADSARHVWKPIEKKLIAFAESAPAPTPASTPASAASETKSTPRKRKADTDGTEGTPTKKPRAAKNNKAKPKAKKEESESEADVSDIKDSDYDEGEA